MSMLVGRTFTENFYVLSVERQLPNISVPSVPAYTPIARHASTSRQSVSHNHIDLCINTQTATVASGVVAGSQNVVSHFHVTSNSCHVASA